MMKPSQAPLGFCRISEKIADTTDLAGGYNRCLDASKGRKWNKPYALQQGKAVAHKEVLR
ncbi:MAG: hypothetical protein KAG53_00045 [Endozoicomonadaceae bacterium]|nr:hypothetical protein [Endozoicomonadaceae bacterium]